MDIKTARQAGGLTQKRLADLAGINIRQIQKLEAGEILIENLSAKNFMALADVLGLDPHELLAG